MTTTRVEADRAAGRPILGPVLGMVLACHPGPTAAVTAAVTAYAALFGRSAAGVTLVGLTVVCGQLTTGWQNDAIDAPLDERAGRRDKPIAIGLISRRAVATGAVVAAVACIVTSYLSGWKAGSVHIVAVGLGAAYNAGLKRTVFSILPYIGAFGLLPCFATLGAPGSPFPPWSVPVAVALLGSAAHVLNVLPDAEVDRRSGVRSLPLRLPLPVAWAMSGLCLVGSCALLAFGTEGPDAGTIVAFVACAGIGGGAVYAGGRGSQWGFRLACFVAVADVGLLAAARR